MKLCILALLFAVALAEDRPYLLVRKSIINGEIIANKNTFVQIEIFNVGASTAHDVNLDDNWDEKFALKGLSVAHWDRIAPYVFTMLHSIHSSPTKSGANVSHIYAVSAEKDGYYRTQLAKVTYRSSVNGPAILSRSTSVGDNIEVIPRSLSTKNAASHLQEWAIFGALVLASSALPFAMWFYVQRNFENGLRKVDKKQQ